MSQRGGTRPLATFPTRQRSTREPFASTTERSELARLTAAVGATATAATLSAAVAVRVAMAATVRELLGYTFPGVPARLGVAIGIFANNGRAILGVFGLLLVAQTSAHSAAGPGRPML